MQEIWAFFSKVDLTPNPLPYGKGNPEEGKGNHGNTNYQARALGVAALER
jgi:hypothetical protein